MSDIKVWVQMFFDDGSVSEGHRIPIEIYEDILNEARDWAYHILKDNHRTEGHLVIWGGGEIFHHYYHFSSDSFSRG